MCKILILMSTVLLLFGLGTIRKIQNIHIIVTRKMLIVRYVAIFNWNLLLYSRLKISLIVQSSGDTYIAQATKKWRIF